MATFGLGLGSVAFPPVLSTALRCSFFGSTFESEMMEVEVVVELKPLERFFSSSLQWTTIDGDHIDVETHAHMDTHCRCKHKLVFRSGHLDMVLLFSSYVYVMHNGRILVLEA